MGFVCLVLEPVGLIAEDLAALIGDIAPDARVILAASPEEALAALGDQVRIGIAFADLPPARLRASLLGKVLEGAQVPVVFLGYEAEARAEAQRFLELPFAEEAVAAELERARRARA